MSDGHSDRGGGGVGGDGDAGVVAAGDLPIFSVEVASSMPPFDGYGDLNAKRAKIGGKHVARFARKHYGTAEDQGNVEMAASDLICSVLHFARSEGVDPAALLEKVGRSFEGDFEDEAAGDWTSAKDTGVLTREILDEHMGRGPTGDPRD